MISNFKIPQNIKATLWLRIPGKGEVQVWTASMAAAGSGLPPATIRALRARQLVTSWKIAGTVLFDVQEVLGYANRVGVGHTGITRTAPGLGVDS